MLRRIGVVLITFCAFFTTIHSSAQTTYTFKKLANTGNAAPAPPLLSEISEFAFNDKGQVAYVGDNAVFFRSGQNVSIVANFGHPAPGGGNFTYGDNLALNSAGQLVFREGVTLPGTSGLFYFPRVS